MVTRTLALAASSFMIRSAGYVFLRWIPGHHFPPVIFTAFAVYVVALASSYSRVSFNGTRKGPQSYRRAIWAALSGIPSSRAWVASVLTVLTNALIVLMVCDFTFAPKILHGAEDLAFARVGHVSDTSARILVREPAFAAQPVSVRYWPAELPATKTDLGDTTQRLAVAKSLVSLDTDFTGVFEAEALSPDTKYSFLTSRGHSGSFTTAPKAGQTSERTANEFTFVHSSCTVPNFPYVPFRHHLSTPGFRYLADLLPILKAQFMVFLGDFIYIDVPRRFGTDKDTYRREYRWVYGSPDWPSVTSQPDAELPWIHVYDDHEIANDWDKNETGLYAAAADPWQHYQVSVNPPAVRPGASYFSFVHGPASFFMMDTRRYRTPFDKTNGTWTGTDSTKSMLGETQRDDLLAWIRREEPDGINWKVIISSIPFTKNWRFGSEDTWAGYLGERQVLLEAMWDVSTSSDTGFIVLSGDRHEFAATAFPPPSSGKDAGKWPARATVHEFSASPLSMFYLPIRTYRQEDEDDVCLQYLPDGNSKFGAVKIITGPRPADRRLEYTLYIDGKTAWEHTLRTPAYIP